MFVFELAANFLFAYAGGETIKQINQQTGAHCEIDRRQQTNMSEKTFIIKGTPDQIEHAKRLFSEKLNMVSTSDGNCVVSIRAFPTHKYVEY